MDSTNATLLGIALIGMVISAVQMYRIRRAIKRAEPEWNAALRELEAYADQHPADVERAVGADGARTIRRIIERHLGRST